MGNPLHMQGFIQRACGVRPDRLTPYTRFGRSESMDKCGQTPQLVCAVGSGQNKVGEFQGSKSFGFTLLGEK